MGCLLEFHAFLIGIREIVGSSVHGKFVVSLEYARLVPLNGFFECGAPVDGAAFHGHAHDPVSFV